MGAARKRGNGGILFESYLGLSDAAVPNSNLKCFKGGSVFKFESGVKCYGFL